MQVHEKKIRSILLPLTSNSLLLPHSAMLEVLPEREVTPLKNIADWVLGEVSWSNETIPLIDMEKVLGVKVVKQPKRSRIVILMSLLKENNYQYIAIKTTGVPRLIQFEGSTLKNVAAKNINSEFIKFHGEINNQAVVIPDMKRLESAIFNKKK